MYDVLDAESKGFASNKDIRFRRLSCILYAAFGSNSYELREIVFKRIKMILLM